MKKLLKQGKRLGLVAMAIFLAGALLLGSVVPAKATEEVIKIGWRAIFTGPLATFGVPVSQGAIDAAKFINEHGGVDGIEIDMVWYDTRAEVPRGVMAHKRFKEVGAVAELCFVCSLMEACAPLQVRDKMPLLYIGTFTSPAILTKPPWIFPCGSTWEGVAVAMAKGLVDMWTEERPLRFGAIIHDLVDAHIQVDATEKHAAELGIEFVGREVVPFIPPTLDTSVEWIRLAAKKPDWVYIFGSGMTFVTSMKDAARLGIRDKGIQLLPAPFSADERTLNSPQRMSIEKPRAS